MDSDSHSDDFKDFNLSDAEDEEIDELFANLDMQGDYSTGH